MDQNSARQTIEAAAKSAQTMYWATRDQDARAHLMDVSTNLNDLLAKLNQDDLASHEAEFQAAGNLLKTQILPKLQALDKSVEKLIQAEGVLKTGLGDLMKVSTTVSFFKLPGI